MNPDVAWPVWSRERAQRVESALEGALPAADESPQSLHAAMRYAALGGGKRVRALLAYASGELPGADAGLVDHAAVAVELIHAYSLVHDDLPCMDDDVLRRGKATCHVAFGEATALLAGDALQSGAFEALAAAPLRDRGQAVLLLAQAVGSRGMAGGQEIDLAAGGQSLDLSEIKRRPPLTTLSLNTAPFRSGRARARSVRGLQAQDAERYAPRLEGGPGGVHAVGHAQAR